MKKIIETVTNETQPSDTRLCWTINGLDGKPFMQIRPLSTDLCYQLWEWGTTNKRTGETVEEWKPMDCYPWDLFRAFMKVNEYMVIRQGGVSDDVRKMAGTILKIEERLQKAIEDVQQ